MPLVKDEAEIKEMVDTEKQKVMSQVRMHLVKAGLPMILQELITLEKFKEKVNEMVNFVLEGK